MTQSVRRLDQRDAAILRQLALDDEDFDIADRGGPIEPLAADAADAYLTDPGVMHWIAESDGIVTGHLYAHRLRKRAGDQAEVLLYEIGVRSAHRRRGVGRALVDALYVWMKEHEVHDVWVVADNPGAVAFYHACGFETVGAQDPDSAAIYMQRSINAEPDL